MSLKTFNHAARRSLSANVFESYRQSVYRFGVERLASVTGQRPGTIYNKADASDDSHHQPTLRDLLQLMHASGDLSTLDALCETFGSARFDCSGQAQASDEALLELVLNLGAESGDFHSAVAQGLKAKRFTPEQLQLVRSEAFDMVSALMSLVARLEGYLDE